MKYFFNYILIAFIAVIFCLSLANATQNYGTLIAIASISAAVLFGLLFHKAKEPTKKQAVIILAFILLLCIFIRIIWITTIPTTPVSDYEVMYRSAVELANGNSPFQEGSYFHRFPHLTFYVFTLAQIIKYFGTSLLPIKIINLIFQVISVVIIYKIVKMIKTRKAGLFAAFLYAIFPASVTYSSVLVTENFAMPFFMLSVYYLIKAYKNSASQKEMSIHTFLSGLFLTVGSLYRGVAPIFFAAYIIGILTVFRTKENCVNKTSPQNADYAETPISQKSNSPRSVLGCISKVFDTTKRRKLSALLILLATYILTFQSINIALYKTGITRYYLDKSAVPYTIYCLVGFNFETNGAFSAEDQNIYFEKNGNLNEIKEEIKTRLTQRLTQNPEKILPLLITKTRAIWTHPDFAGIYWSASVLDQNAPYLNALYVLSNIYYCALLIGVLTYAIRHRKSDITCLLGLLLLGFEGALMLMEVQARYTFIISFILPIMAALSLTSAKSTEKEKIK